MRPSANWRHENRQKPRLIGRSFSVRVALDDLRRAPEPPVVPQHREADYGVGNSGQHQGSAEGGAETMSF